MRIKQMHDESDVILCAGVVILQKRVELHEVLPVDLCFEVIYVDANGTQYHRFKLVLSDRVID